MQHRTLSCNIKNRSFFGKKLYSKAFKLSWIKEKTLKKKFTKRLMLMEKKKKTRLSNGWLIKSSILFKPRSQTWNFLMRKLPTSPRLKFRSLK